MGIRLLGPVELVAGDRRVELRSARQRVVLSVLALEANRVVPVERLVDAVWESSPPMTATTQVRICVSELRKLMRDLRLSAAIHTRPSGYQLDVSDGEVDAVAFERLVAAAREQVAQGDVDAAVETLRRADGLWSGPALTGVQASIARLAALRLDDARLAAAEERIGLELTLGLHREMLNELRELADRHPLRESVQRTLMLALYRSGRQAEALDVYRAARENLVTELGIEPGRELRELHHAVLVRDPLLDIDVAPDRGPLAAEKPRQLPAAIADFTGREDDLAALRRCLVVDGGPAPFAPRVAAVSGPGGVGKSTLAIRAAHELSDEFPDGQLYADLRGAPGDAAAMRVLDRFLRALGVAGTAVPERQPERSELYRSRLADRQMLILLDDVADERQVRMLLPGSPGCGVIVTSRTRLTALDGAQLIDVEVLDDEGTRELLARLSGPRRLESEAEATRRLMGLCAGLPLAIRICASRLKARPDWSVQRLVERLSDESRRLDELTHHGLEVRTTIGTSYRALDDEAQRLFRRFALVTAAPDVPAWTTAALRGDEPGTVADPLDRLVDAQLVTAVAYEGEPDSRYRFHDLVRVYATEALETVEPRFERDAALERLLGGWLAFAEDAHRDEHGGDYATLRGTATRWRPARPTAGAHPLQRLDRERRGLVAAVRQAADEDMDELAWDLALKLITLFEIKGSFDDWRLTTQIAHAAAVRAGNQTGQAAMHYSMGAMLQHQGRHDQALKPLRMAIAGFRATGNRHGLGLAFRHLTTTDRLRGEVAAARRHGAEARELLRAVGDPVGEASTLVRLAHLENDHGDAARARELVDQALAIVREVGPRRGVAQALHASAKVYAQTGDYDRARKMLLDVLEMVHELDDAVGVPHVLLALGRIERRAGRPQAAVRHLRRSAELAERLALTRVVDESNQLLEEVAADG